MNKTKINKIVGQIERQLTSNFKLNKHHIISNKNRKRFITYKNIKHVLLYLFSVFDLNLAAFIL